MHPAGLPRGRGRLHLSCPGRAVGGDMRVVAVGWGGEQAGWLARALGDGWAVALAATTGEATEHVAARPATAVAAAPAGPLGDLGELAVACAARDVPLYICP